VTIRRDVRTAARDLWSDGRGWILVAISAGYFLSVGLPRIFPALLPRIKAEFLLTNATAGLVLSVLSVSFAAGQLPGGLLSDRFGERPTVAGSIVLAGVALLVIVLSTGFATFVGGLVLFGLATRLYGTPRISVLSDIYPARAATAVSLHSAVGNVGSATLPVVATVIASWFAWRVGIGVALPGFLLVALAFWLVVPAGTSAGLQRTADESLRGVTARFVAGITRRSVVVATAMMVLLGFVWQGFTAFLPTYLVEVKGPSEQVAAASFGAFFVAGGVAQPVGEASPTRTASDAS
jgi:MFS family permease